MEADLKTNSIKEGYIFLIRVYLRLYAVKILSLSLRLYGNNFAGESLVHAMSDLVKTGIPWVDFLAGIVLPIPFYFFELLVGVLQALVFTLLSPVARALESTPA